VGLVPIAGVVVLLDAVRFFRGIVLRFRRDIRLLANAVACDGMSGLLVGVGGGYRVW